MKKIDKLAALDCQKSRGGSMKKIHDPIANFDREMTALRATIEKRRQEWTVAANHLTELKATRDRDLDRDETDAEARQEMRRKLWDATEHEAECALRLQLAQARMPDLETKKAEAVRAQGKLKRDKLFTRLVGDDAEKIDAVLNSLAKANAGFLATLKEAMIAGQEAGMGEEATRLHQKILRNLGHCLHARAGIGDGVWMNKQNRSVFTQRISVVLKSTLDGVLRDIDEHEERETS